MWPQANRNRITLHIFALRKRRVAESKPLSDEKEDVEMEIDETGQKGEIG